MFTAWLAENIGTIAAGIILIAIIGTVIAVIVKDRKKGRSSCGCGCANCAMSGACHKSK
jgi:hypothetical protein